MNQLRSSSRWTVTLLCVLVTASCAKAQQKTTIFGSLLDSSDHKPVPWATVGLYKATDTEKPLQNIFSGSKGKFEFADVDTGSYIIIVTYTGYAEKETPVKIEPGKPRVEVEPITLSPAPRQLSGVVVTAAARKPLLEQDDEKMVFNAASDPSLEGQTAADVLRKTPFVTVDGDGNVQLNGQSNFRVLLNGKETSMFAKNLKEALRSFPANLIKKVEVSTTPSAKYDGEGAGGVINIITQKKILGYNGSLGVTHYTTNNSYLNGSINAKYGKFGVSAYFGYSRSHAPAYRFHSETESLNPVAFEKRISDRESRSKSRYNNADIELAWDIDSLNTLSIYGGFWGGTGESNGVTRYDLFLPDNGGIQTSFLRSGSEYDYPSFNVGFDFVHKFRKNMARELTVRAFVDDSRDNNYDFSEQDNPGSDRFTVNNSHAPNKQNTFQVDYTHPFKKGSKLEIGFKTVLRSAGSDYISLLKYDKNDEYLEDPGNSNNFSYSQDVYGAFGTFSFKWKNISFKAGGRFEQTHVNGDFTKTATVVRQDYGTFMPSFFMSRKFRKIHTVSLTYNKRLRRPYIWDLNPFVSNTDSFNVRYGNPGLDPELFHTVEVSYAVFKGNTNISFRLSRSFSNNRMLSITLFDEVKGVSAGTTENAGKYRQAAATVYASTKLNKNWTINGGGSIRYNEIRNVLKPSQHNDGFSGYGNLRTNYQINKRWSAFAGISYSRSEIQLQGQSQGYFYYDFGTNYKLFNDKITVSINTTNIFRRYLVYRSQFADSNFITNSESRSVMQSASFSIRWNFGKLSESVSRKKGVANDDIRK